MLAVVLSIEGDVVLVGATVVVVGKSVVEEGAVSHGIVSDGSV